MSQGVFLIGTDRDVGKTMVGAGLVGLLREGGVEAALMTPVSTGGAVESASGLMKVVGGPGAERRLTNPIQFETLAAPYVAALAEEQPIDIEKILSAARTLEQSGTFVVVEGGGAMVPFRSDYFMIDLLKALDYPCIVVGRSSRGTLNHCLLTLRVLRSEGIEPLGFVLNGYGRFGEGFAESLNAESLEELSGGLPILANMEWRPAYESDFSEFVRDLGECPELNSTLAKVSARIGTV